MAASSSTSTQRSSSASARRRADAKEELRRRILHAAAEICAEGGIEQLSMRHVAERIGYTATTIYLYFENKDALLRALLDESYREFGQRLAEAGESESDPLARLAAIGRAYVAFGVAHPAHYRLMFLQRADFLESLRLPRDDDAPDAFAVLQQAVGAALAAGALAPADPLIACMALWAAVHGLVCLLILGPPLPPEAAQQAIEATVTGMLTGLASPR